MPRNRFYSQKEDRLVGKVLVWLNRRGCIVFRTPPAVMDLYVQGPWTPKEGKRIRRRFATRSAPQVTACMPGGRFLAVRVRGRRILREEQEEWLRTCAALGGAAMVVETMDDLERGWEALKAQRPDPAGWIPAAEVEVSWPRLHAWGHSPPGDRDSRGPRQRLPLEGDEPDAREAR